MRRLHYPTIETTRLKPRRIMKAPAPVVGSQVSTPAVEPKTTPPYDRRASITPQLLHPELTRMTGMYPKTHEANAGQASSVVYSYPTGVAQFYYWYRNLTDQTNWTMFWPGNTGFGAPSRRLAQNQARAIIWGSAPTTTNTSLRALIAQAGVNQ